MLWQNGLLVAHQVFVMFLLMAVGYFCVRFHLIAEEGARQMTNILLVIVLPALLIRTFQIPYNQVLLGGMGIVAAFSLLAHTLGAVLAHLVFRRDPPGRRRVLTFSVVFANCGFMTLPLLEAVLGSEGVFYGAVYIAVFTMIQWTYGVWLISGDLNSIRLRQVLLNPGTLGIAFSLLLFFTGLRLPGVVNETAGFLANLNTPLAMIVIGAQFALAHTANPLRDTRLLLASVLRLLLVPLIILVGLAFLGVERTPALSALLPASAPTAGAVTLFATRHRQDIGLANQAVALTTLASILTMPLMTVAYDWLAALV